MKGLILAAGKGTRLKHLTELTPKCLVKINGKSIIDYQIDALAEAGVDEVIVVAGYCADQVGQHLSGRAKVIVNDDFDTTNSIYSLWIATEEVYAQEFILINGDILMASDLMRRLVKQEGCAALIDNVKDLKDGEMNVVIEHDRIVQFSKTVKASVAQGESVQVTKFGPIESRLLFDRVEQIIKRGEVIQFPAFAYDVIFQKSEMRPVYTEGMAYYEIDTLQDYDACCLQLK